MKRSAPILLAVLTLTVVGLGVSAAETMDDDVLRRLFDWDRPRPETKPKLDPKRIINESNSFLKEREPEMTAEEYALYEKVTTMLATNPEFALKLLEAMMSDKEAPSPAFQFILGNAYYAAGQNDKAEANYRGAVARYPSFLRAWNNLGVLYYATDRFAEAINCFSKSVTLGDRDPTTFGLLGYCLEKQGNVVSAEMAYMQALSGDPMNIAWKEGLLRIYVQGRQTGRAEPLVKSLIAENPAETRYWLIYASILLADQRKLEAIALLETCVEVGVAGPEELTMLGDLYTEQKLGPEAIATYAMLLASDRSLGEKRLLQFARLLIAAGKLDEAGRALDELKAKATPENRLALLQTQADWLAASKQWPQARAEIETLLQEAPLNGPALLTLGRIYVAEDNLPRATFAFEAAERITGTAYQANLGLANIAIRNRHYTAAVQHLQKALSIERTDEIEDYLARVKTLVSNND